MSAQPLDELFAGHGGPWTEAEWLALPESMGTVELLDGALVVSPNAGLAHQRMVGNLWQILRQASPDGVEVILGANVRVRPGGILIPDVTVLSAPGLAGSICDAAHVLLAIEITSPSNAWSDRLVKPEAYARAGIPHYLRVDLDRGPEHLGAVLYSLSTQGEYAEAARADPAGLLVLNQPFTATLDLPVLARATR